MHLLTLFGVGLTMQFINNTAARDHVRTLWIVTFLSVYLSIPIQTDSVQLIVSIIQVVSHSACISDHYIRRSPFVYVLQLKPQRMQMQLVYAHDHYYLQ